MDWVRGVDEEVDTGEVGVQDVARRVEAAVDGIRAGLFLRAAQRGPAEKLEAVFKEVLRMEEGVDVDREAFTELVRDFLNACKASAGKRGGDDAEERAAEVEALVMMVDFNGFYLGRQF
jgi:hypothetical protein